MNCIKIVETTLFLAKMKWKIEYFDLQQALKILNFCISTASLPVIRPGSASCKTPAQYVQSRWMHEICCFAEILSPALFRFLYPLLNFVFLLCLVKKARSLLKKVSIKEFINCKQLLVIKGL